MIIDVYYIRLHYVSIKEKLMLKIIKHFHSGNFIWQHETSLARLIDRIIPIICRREEKGVSIGTEFRRYCRNAIYQISGGITLVELLFLFPFFFSG